MSFHRDYDSDDDEDIDFIRNYYEQPVLQEIVKRSVRAREQRGYLADVACIALNYLPSRYIRHNVDMAFFLSTSEMQSIDDSINSAVSRALAFVESQEQKNSTEL